MSKQPEALLAFLRDNVRYESGALYWTTLKQGRKTGSMLGRKPDARGYIRTNILGANYAVHRLIFLLHHGWLPECVDHIDRNPSNNEVSNLRAATKAQNTCNSKVRADNSAGLKGVRKASVGHKWLATVTFGQQTRRASFDDRQQAAAWAESARIELHGEFARS